MRSPAPLRQLLIRGEECRKDTEYTAHFSKHTASGISHKNIINPRFYEVIILLLARQEQVNIPIW